jgi:hypothetical protein
MAERLNWFDYGFCPKTAWQQYREAGKLVSAYRHENPEPLMPKNAPLAPRTSVGRKRALTMYRKYIRQREEWQAALQEVLERQYLSEPPRVDQCVLHVNSIGGVVEAISIDPNKELMFYG